MGVDTCANDGLHHGQVLEVIMSLEEGVAREELDEDAPYAPDVAWVRPAETEYNLWSSVMAGADDRRMILVLERSRTKINQPDLSIEEDSPLARLAVRV